jgi:hypothetical protein
MEAGHSWRKACPCSEDGRRRLDPESRPRRRRIVIDLRPQQGGDAVAAAAPTVDGVGSLSIRPLSRNTAMPEFRCRPVNFLPSAAASSRSPQPSSCGRVAWFFVKLQIVPLAPASAAAQKNRPLAFAGRRQRGDDRGAAASRTGRRGYCRLARERRRPPGATFVVHPTEPIAKSVRHRQITAVAASRCGVLPCPAAGQTRDPPPAAAPRRCARGVIRRSWPWRPCRGNSPPARP